ncbi:hypothetical protein BRC83_00445 [Halobacteriales archaeon QS_1_68_17]|nr:MAG: hypothetical protein BRC83_00445 [Halobacteriales archaeon QS_1_68_17]
MPRRPQSRSPRRPQSRLPRRPQSRSPRRPQSRFRRRCSLGRRSGFRRRGRGAQRLLERLLVLGGDVLEDQPVDLDVLEGRIGDRPFLAPHFLDGHLLDRHVRHGRPLELEPLDRHVFENDGSVGGVRCRYLRRVLCPVACQDGGCPGREQHQRGDERSEDSLSCHSSARVYPETANKSVRPFSFSGRSFPVTNLAFSIDGGCASALLASPRDRRHGSVFKSGFPG